MKKMSIYHLSYFIYNIDHEHISFPFGVFELLSSFQFFQIMQQPLRNFRHLILLRTSEVTSPTSGLWQSLSNCPLHPLLFSILPKKSLPQMNQNTQDFFFHVYLIHVSFQSHPFGCIIKRLFPVFLKFLRVNMCLLQCNRSPADVQIDDFPSLEQN